MEGLANILFALQVGEQEFGVSYEEQTEYMKTIGNAPAGMKSDEYIVKKLIEFTSAKYSKKRMEEKAPK